MLYEVITLVALDFEIADKVYVRASLGNFVFAQPTDDVVFNEVFQTGSDHHRLVQQGADQNRQQQGNDRQPAILLALGGDQAVDLRLQA